MTDHLHPATPRADASRKSIIEHAFGAPPSAVVKAEAASLTDDAAAKPGVAHIDLDRLRKNGFLVPATAPSAASEAIRIAKRHVLLHALGGRATPPLDRGRVLVVTSAHPNEGKTFCAINLALSLSGERDVEVLLIDADSIKPEIMSHLGIGGTLGLMDALAAETDPARFIVATSIPNLSVLPVGRRSHDDTELLRSPDMHRFIHQQLQDHPRRILVFDTAPALAASSSPALASHAGQVVMVVRADATREDDLAAAVQLFSGEARVQLLLNRASFATTRERYAAYYGQEG